MSTKSTKSGGKSKSDPEPRKPRAAKTAPAKSSAAKSAPAKKASLKKAAPAAETAPAKKPAAKKTAAKKAAAPAEKATRTAKSRIQIEEVEAPVAAESKAPQETQSEPAAMMEAYRADVTSEAEQGQPEMEPAARPSREAKSRKKAAAAAEIPSTPVEEEPETEPAEPRPEPHLERLQKILSQSGVASRRHAEEMIVAGRVIVNGQVITQLGAKADPGRDHIRVDGKLLQTTVRHRTFLLNKPKGYVTTVSDPEGRPTVMHFFEKVPERLYPVGRLDFQSEGLLLVTNDGELSNALTRAASGVEKIYVVKVAGQPGADAIERLRAGVSIERGEQGSGRVRTAPAQIRQIRQGENPWFEVILTEGRNRELRKMFQAIGHYVEKIRRVAYGPLVLDVEPGQIRELHPEEIQALRLTAEGKLKPKRPRADTLLPKEAGRPAEERSGFRPRRGPEGRPPRRESGAPSFSRPYRERSPRPEGAREERSFRPRREAGEFRREERPRFERPERGDGGPRREAGPRRESGPRREGGPRPEGGRRFERPGFDRGERRPFGGPRTERPGGPREERPRFEGQREDRFGGPREQRSGPSRFGARRERPAEERGGERGERPRFNRGGGFGQRPPREREAFGREERPRREFRPRQEGAPRGERPARPARPGGEGRGWNRQEGRPGGNREARPQREDRPRREGSSRPEGERERRPSNGRGPQNRRPGFGGGRPGGSFRKGGPPRRDRG